MSGFLFCIEKNNFDDEALLAAIPENEFKRLAEDEARYSEVIRVRLAQTFEEFLRVTLRRGWLYLGTRRYSHLRPGSQSLQALCTDRQRAVIASSRESDQESG